MRLLLIEDDDEIAKLLERFLIMQKFDVVHVRDGAAGISAFVDGLVQHKPYNVVLTDGLLPKKNGFEVASAIRATPGGEKVGIVLMSAAFRGASARIAGNQAGIDATFAKPFVLAELRDKLIELAERHLGIVSLPRTSTSSSIAAPKPSSSPPKPASSTSFASPPKTSPPSTSPSTPPAPALTPHELKSAEAPAAALLLASRTRLDGIVTLTSGESVLRVAFLRGVVVGADDNLPEHALGTWLRKQGRLTDEQARALDERMTETGERVAEALIALGVVDGMQAIDLVNDQVRARLRRALLWRGQLDVVKDADAASALACDAIDLIETILRFGLEDTHNAEAAAFVSMHQHESLLRTADFDAGLVAFARLRPQSRLPQVLMAPTPTVAAATAASDAVELWALRLAGLVRLHRDAVSDPRAVPRALRGAQGAAGLVDTVAVARVCAVLLRARGTSVYRLLDLPAEAPSATVRQRLQAVVAEVGPAALADKKLGPAHAAARELWALLEEWNFVFSDEALRARYDETLQPSPLAPAAARTSSSSPSQLLAAKELIVLGSFAEAIAVVDACLAERPDDLEALAMRAYVGALSGDREASLPKLVDVARRHPQSARPLYYLGLLALAERDFGRARHFLAESQRRAPDDVDVAQALRLVPAPTTPPQPA
jgi:CheY-like chemotaxis protein